MHRVGSNYYIYHMGKQVKKEIDELKRDVPKVSALADEYLFSLVCFKYFYNNGELSAKDFKDVFVDGRSDGGIDLISILESNEEYKLLLIQSKYWSGDISETQVLDIFIKIDKTIKDFVNNSDRGYSRILKKKFKDKLADIEDKPYAYELVLFVSIDLTIDFKSKITEALAERFQEYEISIFGMSDIENQIESVLEPIRYVQEASVKFANEHGIIKYLNNGVMVNISANSLRDLFDRFRDRGLFEQNFRYFIKNKRIDDNIVSSLKGKRKEFWFLNNGIIIGCEDFEQDGNKIKLYKFSIINGCQTTTLIGNYKGKNEAEDFFLPCKIVKPRDNVGDDEYNKFISEIAESSNSQKPISDRDLKANKPEQRKLQLSLKEQDPKIYLEIKRGEDAKKRGVEKWQTLSNDFYGQLILSFNFQQPGTARSFKKKIFAEEFVYNKIFKRKIDKNNIVDLLRLASYYDNVQNKFFNSSVEAEMDLDMENVFTNGKLVMLSVLGFLIKLKRKLVDLSKMRNDEDWISEIQKDNLENFLFANELPDDFMNNLESILYELAINIKDTYDARPEDYKTVTNFFKSDKYYSGPILKGVVQRIWNHPSKKRDFDKYLMIFS